MKKMLLGILAIVIVALSTGCWKPNYENEPSNMYGTRWVSENPDIWFEVPEEKVEDGSYYGILSIEDSEMKIKVSFGYFAAEMTIVQWEGMELESGEEYTPVLETDVPLAKGECDYQPDKCIVTIYPEEDTLFNGKYETIVFVKEPLETSSSSQTN